MVEDAGNQDEKKRLVELVLDSACFDHACPQTFVPEIPIRQQGPYCVVRAANGKELQHFGRKMIDFLVLPGRSRIRIDFQVVDIRRALISVGKLVENDYTVEFGKNGGKVRRLGKTVNFTREGTMFKLQAVWLKPEEECLSGVARSPFWASTFVHVYKGSFFSELFLGCNRFGACLLSIPLRKMSKHLLPQARLQSQVFAVGQRWDQFHSSARRTTVYQVFTPEDSINGSVHVAWHVCQKACLCENQNARHLRLLSMAAKLTSDDLSDAQAMEKISVLDVVNTRCSNSVCIKHVQAM